MIARYLAAVLIPVSLIFAGCRGGPVAPAGPSPFLLDLDQLATVSHPLAVPLGDATMQIWGYVLGDSPGPLCGPVLGTSQGTLVTTLVRVDRAGTGWIARSRPGVGTLEFRFDQTGRATAEGEGVSGMAVGVAFDTAIAPGGPPKDLSVTVAEAPELAIVDGIGSSAVPFLRGTLKGRVRFTDSLGGLSTCARVWWTLQPAEGVKIPPPGRQHLVYSGLARTFQATSPVH